MSPSHDALKNLRKWFVLLLVLMVSVVASADDKNKKSPTPAPTPTPTPRPTPSAPSKTAAPKDAAREPRIQGGNGEHEHGSAHGTGATDHGSTHTTGATTVQGGISPSPSPSPRTGTDHGSSHAKGVTTDHGNPQATGAVQAGSPAAATTTDHGGAHTKGVTTDHGNTHATGVPAGQGGTPTTGATTAHGAVTSRPASPITTREFKSTAGLKVQANYRDGQVRSIQAPNLRIDRGLRGDRRIVTEHNGLKIVTVGPRTGYSQRAFYNRGGREYVSRTYFFGGRRYAYAYRTYSYGGHHYYAYAPSYFYRPAYYGWAYNPWPAPVRYSWGWDDEPWYGYYGPYFSPYRSYPTASFWLTDYVIAESLRAAYDSQSNADVDTVRRPVAAEEQLDPDVKQVIANEIKRQIAAERAAADNPGAMGQDADQVPPALDPNSRIFVVSTSLDTIMSTGQECALTPGDVLLRTTTTAGDDNRVDVTVASSKRDDCFAGSTVSVDLGDLQEMHNHLRQLLDSGLKTLADNSGRNGLPAAPDTATRAGEVPAPVLDASVDREIQQQQSEADRMETEATPQD